MIHLPSMTLGVVEACSGIRSLFTLLALSAAIALTIVTRMHWALRVGLVLSAVPIAIVTNAFRVTATGFLSHYWGSEMAQGFYHDFSGWLIFLVAFGVLGLEAFLIGRLTEELPEPALSAVEMAAPSRG